MIITRNTTDKEILAASPNAVEVFSKHSMCHIDDIDGLILDLQKFFDARPVPEAS